MSYKKFGIGVVGCGNISDTHAQAIQKTTNGKLVSAHSRNKVRLNKFCNRYNIQGSISYEDFLANQELDIVSVCTPSGTHLDYGKKAAEAGKHVIVEKPIEVTINRGQELIQSCMENDVDLAVIYQNRFDGEVNKMRKLLEGEEFGTPILASASVRWYRSQAYYSKSNWRGSLDLDGGGVVINQSIHTIDLLQWLIGDIESVTALKGTFTHPGIEAEDTAVSCLKYKNGAIGVFEASTSITPPQKRRIEINGSKGTVMLDGGTVIKKFEKKATKDSVHENKQATGASSPLAGMDADNHHKQFDAILQALATGNTPVVSGAQSLKSLAVVESIYKSAELEQPVLIDSILQ